MRQRAIIGANAFGVWTLLCFSAVFAAGPVHAADVAEIIARVKHSVVAIGTYARGRSPEFQFRGTGFAAGDGKTVVTNLHVLPGVVDATRREVLALLMQGPGPEGGTVRELQRIAVDPGSDLALLRFEGASLPVLKIGDSDAVREGQSVLFTGFPIGAVLGPYPATHRGMVSAITPIAIPQGRAADLNPAVIRRLAGGAYPVFQLDATAYPGNSGSPVYDPTTGDVLGIVNLVFVKGTKESALSQPSGITYAIPSRHIEDLLKAAR